MSTTERAPSPRRATTDEFDRWRAKAACRNDRGVPFYPPSHHERRPERRARELAAKEICSGCPVRTSCLEHALAHDERYGVWGGLTDAERRVLLEGPDRRRRSA